MLDRIRAAGVELQDVDGQLRVVGQMTAMQRDWVNRHEPELMEALRVERETPPVCATCSHVIDLDTEEWRYRLNDGLPLCQGCCERTDTEMAKWRVSHPAGDVPGEAR